jgi:hypothetical protein
MNRICFASTITLMCYLSIRLSANPIAAIDGIDSIDFEKYPAREGKSVCFKITNKGDSTLKITGVRNTCACIKTAISKQEIEPGGKTELTVEVIADSIYEKYSKSIYIQTDDSENKFLSFTVAGDPVPIFAVKPRRDIYAGRIKAGMPWRQEVTLSATEAKVEPNIPLVKASIPATAELKPSTEGNFVLSLEINPPFDEAGEFNCKILVPVKNPSGWKDIEICISGQYGIMLLATPAQIVLPASASTPIERSIEIRLLGDDSTSMRPENITISSPLGVESLTKEKSPGIVLLKLKFTPESLNVLKAGKGTSIQVKSSLGKLQALKIPLKFADH